jgi:hypothetical protein
MTVFLSVLRLSEMNSIPNREPNAIGVVDIVKEQMV